MTQRRDFGQIMPLRSGNFLARYTHAGTRWSCPDGSFTTKTAAKVWLTKERALIESGKWTPPRGRPSDVARAKTVYQWSREWLAGASYSPKERAGRLRYLQRFVDKPLGGRALVSVTLADIEAIYNPLSERTHTQAVRVYQMLHRMFEVARAKHYIDANPCAIPGATIERAPVPVPVAEDDEVEIIVKMFPPEYAAMVPLMAWLGPRGGEVRALRRRDFVARGTRLTIRRGVTFVGAVEDGGKPLGLVEGRTKTETSDRSLVLPSDLARVLDDHLLRYVDADPDALLFPAKTDKTKVMSYSVFHRMWRVGVEAADRPDLRPHDLRGTAATRFLEAGATVTMTKRLLGHSSDAAVNRYLRATDPRMVEVHEALARRRSGG